MEAVSSERSETATDTINRELELLANVCLSWEQLQGKQDRHHTRLQKSELTNITYLKFMKVSYWFQHLIFYHNLT